VDSACPADAAGQDAVVFPEEAERMDCDAGAVDSMDDSCWDGADDHGSISRPFHEEEEAYHSAN